MNQKLLDKILNSPRLPSLPSIALEVIELVQQRDVNIKQIAHTIQHDPALSSKILKTVNSSFYGQAHSVGTISHALVVLGLNSVKTLALGFSLVGNLAQSSDDGFNHFLFWKRSLYGAVAARSLAKQVGLVQQEESFLGGLLQDMGLLAMLETIGDEYLYILSDVGADHAMLKQREQLAFDLDHAELGGIMADKWKLPPILANSIRYHDDPDSAPEDVLPAVRCVALGSIAADIFVNPGAAGEALERYYHLSNEWFSMGQEQAEPLLNAIHTGTIEMKRLFDLPTGEFESSDIILSRANEALLNLSMLQQQQAAQLEAKNKELVAQAEIDPLTGVANRRKFNDYIEKQFTHTQQSGEPVSILFMDVDHFKKFNDTYGHQTGDQVLSEVASLLEDLTESPTLVCRYGGEEFAIIMPDTDRFTAAKKAEEIRLGISEKTIISDEGQSLHVTASIGVAAYDGTFFTKPDQLIKAADQGVYAAKNAGRNAVRVFAPRVKAPAPKPSQVA